MMKMTGNTRMIGKNRSLPRATLVGVLFLISALALLPVRDAHALFDQLHSSGNATEAGQAPPTHQLRPGSASARSGMDLRRLLHGTREQVVFESRHSPGTILVDTQNRFLYLVEPGGTAQRFVIGVAREGFEWSGRQIVSRKAKWPDWRPPASMRQRQPELPAFVAGGPENPLGARALYLGDTLYRIHGTNEEDSIGEPASAGCIRMLNDDVRDLYERVSIGAQVIVY